MSTQPFRFAYVACVGVLIGLGSGCGDVGWRSTLSRELPRLGHRNLIVIADSAYPLQSAPGIRTVYTDQKQLATVAEVLKAVEAAAHVNPVIYLDKEIDVVSEADAPGIGAYRDNLKKLLGTRAVTKLPHMKLIGKLDETSKLFNVLVLKTDLTLPYTSVFIELDCGYWGPEEEARMRERFKKLPK